MGANYTRKMFALTIRGQVSIHLVDGEILTGTLTAQDQFHLFLMVEDAPVMISRSQIKYVQAEMDQTFEQRIVQESFLVEERTDTVQDEESDRATLPKSQGESLLDELTKTTDSQSQIRLPDEDEEADDITFVFDEPDLVNDIKKTMEAGMDMDEMTYVLDESEADQNDLTVVLDQEEEEEDLTFVFDQEEEKPPAQLVCTGGPHAGEIFELRSGVTTLGRATDNVLPLPYDKEISRRHAIILQEGDEFIIQDQNSLNGTFVNNQRIEGPHPLADGDTIIIGVSHLEYKESSN